MKGSDKKSSLMYDPSKNRGLNSFPKPRYIITVDTEEEFDWDKPFSRDGHGLKHIPSIDRFQNLCIKNSVKPIYLIDFPIASDKAAVEIIRHYCDQGVADVGIQLHPWVNPPFTEDINDFNSYACNLEPELERTKLTNLCEFIAKEFNTSPSIYRAGRYGACSNTVEILSDLGVKIDTSVRSRFSYSMQHGPDYSKFPVNPYWIKENKLLELPVTTVYTGLLGNLSNTIYHNFLESKISRSLLSRTKMIERIALTPEGTPSINAIAGIDRAINEGIEILNFSFHSPSLAPGFTPYVRTNEDLETFYSWWNIVFEHLDKHNIEPASLDQIIDLFFNK